jgi:hypothetical protein
MGKNRWQFSVKNIEAAAVEMVMRSGKYSMELPGSRRYEIASAAGENLIILPTSPYSQ